MNIEAQTEALSDVIGRPALESGIPAFVSLRQSAALEFHASVQLLAERARFLTGAVGVALALNQDGQLVYCAAVGSMVPEIGATANVPPQSQEKAERLSIQISTGESHVAVPVLRDGTVEGFFELVPGASAFEDTDLEAITRLSAMVGTALEHRDAAEQTESLIAEARADEQALPTGPMLWHAPEAVAPEPTPGEGSQSQTPADVHACTACGFPVSGRRTLCLDCEKHQEDPKYDPKDDLKSDSNSPVEMFATGPHESWISAHGYTIASVLVSALAVAIIYWLR
jgi:hypothetical protein